MSFWMGKLYTKLYLVREAGCNWISPVFTHLSFNQYRPHNHLDWFMSRISQMKKNIYISYLTYCILKSSIFIIPIPLSAIISKGEQGMLKCSHFLLRSHLYVTLSIMWWLIFLAHYSSGNTCHLLCPNTEDEALIIGTFHTFLFLLLKS